MTDTERDLIRQAVEALPPIRTFSIYTTGARPDGWSIEVGKYADMMAYHATTDGVTTVRIFTMEAGIKAYAEAALTAALEQGDA